MSNDLIIWRVYRRGDTKSKLEFIGTVLANSESSALQIVERDGWKSKYVEDFTFTSIDELVTLS